MQKMERMPGDAIHVCVDAYPNRVLQGRLQSAAWVGEMPFVSLMDFFKQVEHLLDEQLPPQAFTTMRRFGPVVKPEKTQGEVGQGASGKLATFYVRILFRQNASWQGTVLCPRAARRNASAAPWSWPCSWTAPWSRWASAGSRCFAT